MHFGLHKITISFCRFLGIIKNLNRDMNLHGLREFLRLRSLLCIGAIVCKLRGIVLTQEEIVFDRRLAIRILIRIYWGRILVTQFLKVLSLLRLLLSENLLRVFQRRYG